MIITMLAQLRHAASVVFGLPFSPWALNRLIDDLQRTLEEFGAPGEDSLEMLQGPALNQQDRREVQLRRFCTQAVRAAQETTYYRTLFTALKLDPKTLTTGDIARIPLTTKAALRQCPDAFVRAASQPIFRTTTTGTTGKPTTICFSAQEMQSYVALNALGLLGRQEVTAEDIVQISTSARATLGNTCFAQACQRVGALWYQTGLVEPAFAIAMLRERHRLPGKKSQASYLNIYPSYLGQLVEYGLAAGYGPSDFGVERISVGGELVTVGLKARAQELFGSVRFNEGYGMTETWPTAGLLCSQGHLHFESSQALVEVIDPESEGEAQPGCAGSLVVTPLPPYRETMLLLRYDTEDMVRTLDRPLTCELCHQQATSNLLGKRRLAVRHESGWSYPREILEALEAVDAVPLPARCGFWAVAQGVAVEVVVRDDNSAVRNAITKALEEQRVPLTELHLVQHPCQLQHPLPLRGDLREHAFSMLS